MMATRWYRFIVVHIALILAVGIGASSLAAQSQDEGRPWELNAGDFQALGLHLPSYMPTIRDAQKYQALLPTHQEFLIDWDPHTGYDHPVFREQVAERSLKHGFTLLERKQNIKGNAPIGVLTLSDLGIEIVGVTSTSEVRGFTSGPSLVVLGESLSVGGNSPSEHHEYIMPKSAFPISLPDDPKIEKLVLLLVHPNEKSRLEQVGVIELTAKVAPK